MQTFLIKRINFFLLGIVLLAALLRFWNLGSVPLSLSWDEVSWGYNAYSLGLNGTDEFGVTIPYKYLESFGDFKPPFYAYSDILPIKVFGLNEFATRFPSAFFGTLTILATFFLVKRIFYNSKNKNLIGLFSSLFLAISPWHINLSRAAFEANVASFFVVIGIWAFLAGVQEKKNYLILSAASFALTFYIFNTERIVAPLLAIILALVFRKRLWEIKKQTILAVLVGFAVVVPIVGFLLTPQANTRFKEVNIFSDPEVARTSNQEITNDKNSIFSKFIHNHRISYGLSFTKHYFDNFNSNFLFIYGDINGRFSTRDVGELFIWDLPFIVLGVIILFKKKEGNWWIIPIWLLIGIIPAATARETPHALRTEVVLPVYQILVAMGFVYVLGGLSKLRKDLRFVIGFFIGLALIANVFYYLYGYYSHYPRESAREWQYGYKDSIGYVEKEQDKYDQIFITDLLGRPYIYYLYYLKIDPADFRKSAQINRDVFGFVTVEEFDKYKFGRDVNKIETNGKKTLYVNTSENVPKDAKIKKIFYVPDGSPTLTVYTL